MPCSDPSIEEVENQLLVSSGISFLSPEGNSVLALLSATGGLAVDTFGLGLV